MDDTLEKESLKQTSQNEALIVNAEQINFISNIDKL
jgi:hypothetical protein